MLVILAIWSLSCRCRRPPELEEIATAKPLAPRPSPRRQRSTSSERPLPLRRQRTREDLRSSGEERLQLAMQRRKQEDVRDMEEMNHRAATRSYYHLVI